MTIYIKLYNLKTGLDNTSDMAYAASKAYNADFK